MRRFVDGPDLPRHAGAGAGHDDGEQLAGLQVPQGRGAAAGDSQEAPAPGVAEAFPSGAAFVGQEMTEEEKQRWEASRNGLTANFKDKARRAIRVRGRNILEQRKAAHAGTKVKKARTGE